MKRFEGVFIGNGSNPISRRKKVANFGKIWRENRSTHAPHFRSGPLHLGQRSLCDVRNFCPFGQWSLYMMQWSLCDVPAHSPAVSGRLRFLAQLSLERATIGVAVARVQRSLCMVQRAAGRLERSRHPSLTFFHLFSSNMHNSHKTCQNTKIDKICKIQT